MTTCAGDLADREIAGVVAKQQVRVAVAVEVAGPDDPPGSSRHAEMKAPVTLTPNIVHCAIAPVCALKKKMLA